MRVADIAPAMSRAGVNPLNTIRCAARACQQTFAAIDGFAFSHRIENSDPSLYFFCSAECYLNALSPEAMGRC